MSELLTDGHGIAGRFLGLENEFSNYNSSRVCILPVPFEATTSYQQGTAAGPDAIIEASRNIEGYDVETECEVFQVGIHTMPAVTDSSSAEMLAELEQRTREVLQAGKFPVVLGGEHSISQAPIRACAEHAGPLSVLQFDAHTDLREAYEGNPLSHASVMARVREIATVENVCAVGIRAMDSSEREVAVREDLFFDHELQDGADWIGRVIDRLAPKVYISFDIDVFGSGTMPATGTPEPGGMEWFQALSLLRRVCAEREVVGFDLVELMPLAGFRAPEFLAAKLVYKFLNYRFSGETQGVPVR